MSSIKNALCLLAVVAAYGLAAYWDANQETDLDRQGDQQTNPSAPAATDVPRQDAVPTTHGVQHAHR